MILKRPNLSGRDESKLSFKPRLLFQWHITERCNLHCTHCYQENSPADELSFTDLLKVLEGFKRLLDELRTATDTGPVPGHITVTGGEPFIRKDLPNLLEALAAGKNRFSFSILSNGSFLDSATARYLRELEPLFVQVSIEGTPTTHDRIRGPGDYTRTVSAVKNLVREKIPTIISFTAHRSNYQEFYDVARLGRRLKVSRVWADRFIPIGRGSAWKDQVLSPEETREFVRIMYRAQCEGSSRRFNRTEISMHRALQFLEGGMPYHCTAGDTLLAVQPNGDLYPCRRMPIKAGNLLETPLTELYHKNTLLCALRDRKRTSNGCEGCIHSGVCRGGLKCLSYAVSGNPFNADPGCAHSFSGLRRNP